MKVCDKCKKPLREGARLKVKEKDFELCRECSSRIYDWLTREEQGILGGLFK